MNAEADGRDAMRAEPDRRQPQRGPERRDLLADRYELLELLGRGSSASVWHAYDKRLAREVALKIFHLGSEDREDLGRALREAKAASHIVSDHVVGIRDVAWGGARGAYIDMELCADFVDGELVVGRSMAQTTARDLREAVHWVMEAARGVQTAHELRVFHRDLKPDNILIRPASRSALVTDFGLARQPLWREEDAETPLPGADLGKTWQEVQHYVGTPAYMAPEQADGLFRHLARLPREPGANVDLAALADESRLARIDVYGLGAILYESLAGRPPYLPRQASSDRTLEAMDVLSQVCAGPPPALRGQTRLLRKRGEPRSFRVPRRLDRIVRKAMARQPADRYPTCAALERDLARFLEHQPTSFERHRYHARAALWSTRNWRPVVASSLAVAGFIALFTLWPDDGASSAGGTAGDRSTLALHRQPHALVAPSGPESKTLATAYALRAQQLAAPDPSKSAAIEVRGGKRAGARGHRTQPRPRANLERRPEPDPSRMPAHADATPALSAPGHGGASPSAEATRTDPPVAAPTTAPPVPAVAEAARTDSEPGAAREAAAAFVESARRGTTPLIQVLDASGTITEYCLSSPSGSGTTGCISQASCSADQRERLEKLHRQSSRAWIWHLDAQRRVIRKCEKSRPYDNSIIRKTCDPVVVG